MTPSHAQHFRLLDGGPCKSHCLPPGSPISPDEDLGMIDEDLGMNGKCRVARVPLVASPIVGEATRACPESLEGMRGELRCGKAALTGEDRKPAQSLSKGTHLNPFTLTPSKGRSSTRSP